MRDYLLYFFVPGTITSFPGLLFFLNGWRKWGFLWAARDDGFLGWVVTVGVFAFPLGTALTLLFA